MRKNINKFKSQWQLQLMTIPGIIFVIIFCYIPMIGIIIAFKDYDITLGFFKSQWVGLKYFKEMFNDISFLQAAKNTILLSLYGILLGFPAPILLAIIINEIPFNKFKRVVQTSSYLPHFISFVIVATMWITFLDPKGIGNNILLEFGIIKEPIEFWAEPKLYRLLATIVSIWKSSGWGAIIYLAAIVSIDQDIYEAAMIDGAGRLKRIVYITLPNLTNIISIMFILGIASLVRGSLDFSVLLGNPFNSSVSYVIEHYTLDTGLSLGRYSFATAISLFQSMLALILVIITNWGSGKIGGSKLF